MVVFVAIFKFKHYFSFSTEKKRKKTRLTQMEKAKNSRACFSVLYIVKCVIVGIKKK